MGFMLNAILGGVAISMTVSLVVIAWFALRSGFFSERRDAKARAPCGLARCYGLISNSRANFVYVLLIGQEVSELRSAENIDDTFPGS